MAASEILANVKRQFDPGEVIEIRLKSRGGWHSGYYDYEHFEQMAADVEKYDELRETTAIYYTLNPVQNILLARCMNHIQRAKETTTDAQIKYRKYLPFDIDPERPAGVSSTNEQHEKSIEKGNRVAKWLKEEYGWPDPIKGDSGNGTHLDYRIDEPNTPEAKELVECVQKAVIEQFNDENDGIKIEGWANTARIWKLKGTMTRKGDEIPDQDIYHRRSKILAMPDELQNVTTEQLRDVAALYQPGEVTGPQKSQEQPSKKPKKGKIFDIEAWIKKYKIPVERVKKESDKTIYVLEACLINPEHTGNREAVIIQWKDGKLGYKCHHNSCENVHWIDVREKIEPGYKEKNQKANNHSKYFDEQNRFIPKKLGDEILHEKDIFTYQDTKEIAVYDKGVYSIEWGEDTLRRYAQNILGDDFNISRLKEVIEYIKLKTLISRHDINPDVLLINVKNGMYDVMNDVLLNHDPKYTSTIQLKVTYNKNAQCTEIDAFLNSVMKPSDVPVILQYIGYTCTQDISQQRSLLIDGNKENGKSTFIDLVGELFGEDLIARQSIHDLNTDRFATAQLDGKLLNVFPDLSNQKLKDNSTFKMLTTDRYITGEEKYHQKKTFKNTIHQIYSTNEIPDVDNPDELAFFRRWIMVTFPYTFAGKNADKNMTAKITTDEELSGLFNVCMVGLRALLKRGEFCVNDTAETIQKKYLTKSNPIRAFINECTTYSEYDLQKKVLYDEYVAYCKKRDISRIKTDAIFGRELKKIGLDGGRESAGARNTVIYNLALVFNPDESVRVDDSTMTDFIEPVDSESEAIRHSNHSNFPIVEKYQNIYSRMYAHINSFQSYYDAVTDSKKSQSDATPQPVKVDNSTMTYPDGTQKDQRTRIKAIHDIVLNFQSGNGSGADRADITAAAEEKGINDTDAILAHMAAKGTILQRSEHVYQVI